MKRSFIAIALSVMVSAAAVGCTSADVQEQGAINTETTQEATEEVTQEATEQATEETSEEASADTASSEDSASDESSEAATEGASKDSKSEASDADASTAKADDKKDTASSDNEYDSAIDKLLATKATKPDNADTLSGMARCVTLSNALSDKGVVFSEMDNDFKASLRLEILLDTSMGNSALKGTASAQIDGSKITISEDDAKKLFADVYGEDNFTPAKWEKVENGNLFVEFGDGEPWEFVEHPQFFEDDKYILLTGASVYGDNGGGESFEGYADILFKKNSDSKYGATLVYGRYRKDSIKVSSVETSSELAASKGKTYSGKNLIDGDFKTVWCEGAKGDGAGETITLKLDKKQLVSGIQICNGYTASYDLYNSNGVLTDVSIDFGNGKKVDDKINGYANAGNTAEQLSEYNLNVVELDEPVETDTITIKITGAKKGAKYDDTCVSEVTVF
ncbi:MAG: hypothetical protein IKO84_00820 [Butyrivibrio sp.]|nr:hypothetical protein [Butyrivibrio sp.]